MPRRSAAGYQVARLFAGADATPPAYSLPVGILRRRDAAELIGEKRTATGQAVDAIAPHQVKLRIVDELLETVVTDGQFPDGWADPIVEAEAAERRTTVEYGVLQMLDDAAEGRLINAIRDAEETIVVEHFRPSLAEILADLRDVGPKVVTLPLEDPDQLIGVGEAATKAYRATVALVDRYGALLTGHGALMDLVGAGRHTLPFAELRNVREVLGPHSRNLGQPMPWPDHPIRRALWRAGLGGGRGDVQPEPWVPTAVELEEAMTAGPIWSDRSATLGVSGTAAVPRG